MGTKIVDKFGFDITVGIVGLGLIGGSLAKAFKAAGVHVYGHDCDINTLASAMNAGAIDRRLTEKSIADCNFVYIAIPPKQAVEWFKDNSDIIPKTTIVMDCCGMKRIVCNTCFPIAKAKGLTFIGGHPMAGREVGGFLSSRVDLFQGASFVIVPDERTDESLIELAREVTALAGFTNIGCIDAEEHDRQIAFTSHMPHLISNGFIKNNKSITSDSIFTGGSFRDMTRVAYLDEKMWSELFLENKDFLLDEIGSMIKELEKYKQAIESENRASLQELLLEGKECKVASMKPSA